MMHHVVTTTALLATVVSIVCAATIPLPLGDTVGAGWGTNIHWTSETRPGETAMLAKAFRVARMDFKWSEIEATCGKYDFSAYDTLLTTMEAHGVQPYWILDYGNPCYPSPDTNACKTAAGCKKQCGTSFQTCAADGVWYCCETIDGVHPCNGMHNCSSNPTLHACACLNEDGIDTPPGSDDSQRVNSVPTALSHASPTTHAKTSLGDNAPCNTEACISAFGRFAAAAAAHFKGHGIIFECLNEPNGMGQDNSSVITALCLGAGAEFAKVGELFVGPATSGIDWTYLNNTMNDGILAAFGALSVHPYRGQAPETVIDDYTRLRALIASHGRTPAQQHLPVVSGEWGYTSATLPCAYPNRVDNATQAAYLARMWLTNTLAGIPVSINYDWSDGSNGPADCESNFGSVTLQPGPPGGDPFVPKPKYMAALALQTALGSYQHAGPRVTPNEVPAGTDTGNVFILPFYNTSSSSPSTTHTMDGGPSSKDGDTRRAFAVWSNQTSEVPCTGAPVKSRLDCGHYGISKGDCLSPSNPKGPTCCWEPNQPTVGGPQCYKVTHEVAVSVSFQAGAGCWKVVDVLGSVLFGGTPVCADAHGVLTVSTGQGTPVYLVSSSSSS
eukprot:m.98442 g.98442  ORF g.98442 m.98442 type:complete len:613 (-) comp10258_c0_seq1:3042-4880(-)